MREAPLDALVVGAGVAGLHQLHLLRGQGMRVRGYDAADDVGGTWWWHGYPGARLDTEGHVYQYLFSETLYRDWGWSERFPAGYEVLRWLRFVADRLDLRRDLRLSTRVVDARWDAALGRWVVRTDRGDTVEARFLVACTGVLDGPAGEPDGLVDFTGPVLRTSSWPEKHPGLRGRRVGVLGAGASGVAGIQLVPALAGRVAHLTVFAGAPGHLLPRSNPMYGWQDRERYRGRFDELRATIPYTSTGAEDPDVVTGTHPAARRATIEALHGDGSRALWSATARGLLPAAEVTAYVREAMRDRLADTRLAGVVIPDGDDVGAARVPLESGYLEVLGRDDVDVVDARTVPVVRVHPEGVECADGTFHALDAVVVASAFDAGQAALTGIDVRGRAGRRLAVEPPGVAVPGFPNLFTVSVSSSPLHTATTSLQQQTEWISRALADLRAAGGTVIEATTPQVRADGTGGVGDARRRGDAEAAAGYPSFGGLRPRVSAPRAWLA